jgi:hypothetical protein
MRQAVVVALAVLVGVMAAHVMGKLPSPPPQPLPSTGISMDAARWNIQHSTGVPLHPSPNPGGGWYFDFPGPFGSVNYVTTSVIISAKESVRAVIQITATPDAVFDWRTNPNNTCDHPAHVRLFLQRAGDDLRAAKEFYRWWSKEVAVHLDDGTNANLSVSLADPAQWSSVFGKRGNDSSIATTGFRDAIANLAAVGFTFGGGCFYGHGVRMSAGTARFIATEYMVR